MFVLLLCAVGIAEFMKIAYGLQKHFYRALYRLNAVIFMQAFNDEGGLL